MKTTPSTPAFRPRVLVVAVTSVMPVLAFAQAALPESQGADVVVSATRVEHKSFDLPISIDSVGKERIQDGTAQVNASEALSRVPGIVANNRQNYAQDLQISSRGFGARAPFGVRGVRLVADGIPATMPDGQGQAASFNLATASRLEVLRGPFASLYGNASGGVVQLVTEDGPAEPIGLLSLTAGSYDTWRLGAKAAGQTGSMNYVVDGSRFDTKGYRDHSAARRDQINAKLKFNLGEDTRLTVLGNMLDQPETQDPLGLTRAQFEANPKQADAVTTQFNTRKSIKQNQGGLVLDHRLSGTDNVRATVYSGQREVWGYQSTVGGTGLQAGGVVNLDRSYGGLGLRWDHKGSLAGRPATLTVGADMDAMKERRKGFANNNGIAGALRRDEDDKVSNNDVFAVGEWEVAKQWQVNGGLRHSRVKFSSDDYFITAINPNDSGSQTYSATNGALGVLHKLDERVNLYANLGTGFETPTFTELAYKPGGATGLNFDLKPSRSKQYEIGAKAIVGDNTRLNAALFQVDTTDEIVVAAAANGRTTYKNASSTARRGIELSVDSALGNGFAAYAALTLLDAKFKDSFTSGAVTVPAGNKLPGVARQVVHGELLWRGARGLSAALEVHHSGKVYVNEANADAAGAYTVANVRVGAEQAVGAWRLKEFVRVDNLFDRKYAGSVIVADGNGRFFESAPGRNYLVGVSAQMKF